MLLVYCAIGYTHKLSLKRQARYRCIWSDLDLTIFCQMLNILLNSWLILFDKPRCLYSGKVKPCHLCLCTPAPAKGFICDKEAVSTRSHFCSQLYYIRSSFFFKCPKKESCFSQYAFLICLYDLPIIQTGSVGLSFIQLTVLWD